jgi:hypothetical protein
VLIGFEAEWNYPKLLSRSLEKCADHSEKKVACAFVLRYMKWERQTSSVWKELKDVAAKHGLSIPDLDSHIIFAGDEEHSVKGLHNGHHDELDTSSEPSKRKWDNVFFGNDLTTADGISRLYAAFKSMPVPWNHDQFFAEAIQRVPVGSEAVFTESVGSLAECLA